MRTVLLLLFFSLPYLVFSQRVVTGMVVEGERNTPLAAASVFLSNTSVGTVTTGQGAFEILVPAGRYDLVVSSIGYETYSQTITADAVTAPLTIKLQPKIKELE